MQGVDEASFVSINLDGRECEICLQDTGEELTTCDICAKFLTSGPVQEGFNQLPDLLHTKTQAHRSCFRKFHKLARRLSRGACGLDTIGCNRDSLRDQWLNFNSNNVSCELLLENIRNRISRSNPGSRSGSPLSCGGWTGKPLGQDRCRSDPQLDVQTQELRRGYSNYLFGKHGGGQEDSSQVPEKQPKHVAPRTSEEAVEILKVPALSAGSRSVTESADCRKPSNPREHLPKLCTNQPCQRDNQQHLPSAPTDTEHPCHGHNVHVAISDQTIKSQTQVTGRPRRLMMEDDASENSSSALKTTLKKPSVPLQRLDKSRDTDRGEQLDGSEDKNGRAMDEGWKTIEHLSHSCLSGLTVPDLQGHMQTLQEAVNRACSQLVRHLEEKDRLAGEVASRHVTIQKLVQRQTTLHH